MTRPQAARFPATTERQPCPTPSIPQPPPSASPPPGPILPSPAPIVTELALTDESSASKADLDALEARLTAAISASERRGILAALAIAGLLFAALRLFA